MRVTYVDHSQEFADDFSKAIFAGLQNAGEALVGFLEEAISGPSPSPEGSPPGMETKGKHPGLAHDSIDMTTQAESRSGKQLVRVGATADAPYMGMHEVGIAYHKKPAKRPWLVPTTESHYEELGEAFLQGGANA
jgi:hypothetical protein